MIPDSILSALDRLISGGEPTLLPEAGLEPSCQAVVGRINQLILRLQHEEVNSRILLEGEALPTTISRVADGRLLFANGRARDAFRIEEADLGTRQAEDLWMKPDLRPAFVARVCRDGRVDAYEVEYRRIDGSPFYGLLSASRITFRGEDAILSGFLSITERRLTEQALQKSHALLDEVGAMARVGGWEIDLEHGTVTWSRIVREIHEVDASYEPDLATALAFYTPEALPVITQAVQRAREAGLPFDCELPMVTAKGRSIWVRAIGKADVEEGKVVRIAGVFQDLTERRETEKKARMLAHAVEQSPISILITDARGDIEYANAKTFQLTGYAPAELLGRNPRLLKSGDKPPAFYQELWATLTAGRSWQGEFRNRRKNGECYLESALISPLFDPSGQITHYVAVKEDVTEKKRLEADRETLFLSLKEALDNVKTLRGLLPICAGCKKIRDEEGYWSQLESYFSLHSDLNFTHGLCPDCAKAYFPKQGKPEPKS